MGGIISKKKRDVDYATAKTDKLDHEDFSIGKYLAEGGSGKIFVGLRKSDGLEVALKFFGYVRGWEVDEKEIRDEMETMSSMNHIESVIRIYGYFMDSEAGFIPRKLHMKSFPVIVMELMRGGPLFGRLNYREKVSEKYLAKVFRSILIAVDQLHNEHYVHRDLKLENIMYVDETESSPVRVIDLGMSVKLAEGKSKFIEKTYLVGTPGCYAPESLINNEYSVKTDIWQLGCILYMLLSGLVPFHREKTEQITHRGYYKMEGKGWTGVSDKAKDLVHNILKRKSENRLNIKQILEHPWMKEATDASMDDEYKTRIKRLALRDKMQKFFQENNNLKQGNAERKQHLIDNVPLLKERSSVAQSEGEIPSKPPAELKKELSIFNGKLKNLKTMVVRRMSTDYDAKDSEIDYDAFVSLLDKCNLQELCSPAVFNIFDIGNTGTIDPKEFLITMLAFQPAVQQGGDDSDDAALYFEMFDIKETGYIDLDELKLAIKFLLFMGTDHPQDIPDVEEMFNAIDTAKDGRIELDEFKIFYKQLLSTQNSMSLRID